MADTQIRGLGDSPAPLAYTVPQAQEIVLKSLYAEFDGSGAAVSFFPCIRVRAPGGGIVGEYVSQDAVTAGGSADVSFAPFPLTAASGIRYEIQNVGGTLRVQTTGQDGVTGDGVFVDTEGGGAFEVLSTGSLTLSSQSGAMTLRNEDATSPLQLESDGELDLTSGSNQQVSVTAGPDGELHLTTTGAGTMIFSSGDGFIWNNTRNSGGENVFIFRISLNDRLVFRDHNDNDILAVEESGPSYHIKTGKAWLADL